MRKILMSAAALALFAAPALAQSGGSAGSTGSTDPSRTSTTGTMGTTGTSSSTSSAAMQKPGSQAERQKMKTAMEQAGFTDVEIVDTAYLVRAQTANDETVFMVVDPDNQMAAMAGAGSSRATGGTSTERKSGSGGQ